MGAVHWHTSQHPNPKLKSRDESTETVEHREKFSML